MTTDIINKILNLSAITNRFEAAYVAFHASLIANRFQCIGLEQDDESAASEEVPTDDLPSGWNKTEIFTLRYKYTNEQKLLVKALAIDNVLAVNVLITENDIANIAIDVNRYIDNDQLSTKPQGEYIYKELPELMQIIATFVSKKLHKSVPSPINSDIRRKSPPNRIHRDDDPLRIGPVHVPRPSRSQEPFFNPDGDRIPGMGGGSMLFDPLRSGSIRPPGRAGFPPSNTIPPGARYDPVGPFGFDPSGRGPRRGQELNPDHLPPPGFGSGSGFNPFM